MNGVCACVLLGVMFGVVRVRMHPCIYVYLCPPMSVCVWQFTQCNRVNVLHAPCFCVSVSVPASFHTCACFGNHDFLCERARASGVCVCLRACVCVFLRACVCILQTDVEGEVKSKNAFVI